MSSLVYRCRRCNEIVSEGPHDDAEIALRRAMNSTPTIVHTCPPAYGTGGGAWGVAELIGTSERPKTETAA